MLQARRTTAVTAIEQKRVPEQIAAIIERAEKTFSEKADGKWMKQVIEDVLHPARAFERDHPNLLHRIHEYLEKYDGAERTKEHIVRFERTMTRYHEYRRELLGDTDFTLFVETVTLGQMNDFREYVANEYLLRQEYPDFYIPRMLINHKPKPLSNTTVINIMNLFCTFLHWCKRMKYSDNEVYAVYGCKEPTYGDPFYLTSEERNILYDADLSDCPRRTSRTVFWSICLKRQRSARRKPSGSHCMKRRSEYWNAIAGIPASCFPSSPSTLTIWVYGNC